MTICNRIALVAAVGIAGVGLMMADQWDKKTTITIDESMQLPTTTLQPGTYVIKLADVGAGGATRHVVQFFDKDQKHIITTIEAIPNERLRPTGKSVFAFWEVPAGQPKALRAWFYPGDNFGQEFAYPKAEADRIASSNGGANVPVAKDETAATAPAASETVATVQQTPAPVADTQPAAPAQSAAVVETTPVAPPVQTAPVETAQNTPPPAVTPVPDNSDAQQVAPAATSNTLPQTASDLPLIALLGLLSLTGGLGLNLAYGRN